MGSASVNNPEHITDNDLYAAFYRIQHGMRKDIILGNERLKDILACSESGKIVVASVLRSNNGLIEKIIKASIAVRGRGDSLCNFVRLDDNNYMLQTQGKLMERMKILCAARAAEEVLFGCSTANTMNTLTSGLRIARQLVYHFGFSDLGTSLFAPYIESTSYKNTYINEAVDNMDYDPFLPFLLPGEMEPTCKMRHKMESAALSLLKKSYIDAKNILESYQPALISLATILKRRGEITGTEIDFIINKYSENQKTLQPRFPEEEK